MSLSSRFCTSVALGAALVANVELLSAQQLQPAPPRVQPDQPRTQPAQPRTQPAQPRTQPDQPRTQTSQPAAPGQAVQRQQTQPDQIGSRLELRADAQLAACLVVDNQGEVALGKLAQERAHNPQVKRFGEQMVEDHSQFLAKLQQFTGQGQATQPQAQGAATRQLPAQPERATADRPGAAEQPRQRIAGGQRGGPLDFVAIKRQIGEQCLQSTRKELESKEGREFDTCFMGMQIVKHMHALDTMKVFKEHGSDELAQVLDEGIRTAQTHLDHAKQIMKQLEGSAASTARRESDK